MLKTREMSLKKSPKKKGVYSKKNSKSDFTQKSTKKNEIRKKKKKKLLDEIFITVGPWLMKLYTTPPFILTLMSWVPQSMLAFGILRHFGT